MSFPTTASQPALPPTVLAYCQRHGLTDHLMLALRLAEETFDPVRAVGVVVETDPETDEEAVIIDVSCALGSDEAVAQKREYTRRWVESAPPEVIGRIRLIFALD
jgi:hypothetical protein